MSFQSDEVILWRCEAADRPQLLLWQDAPLLHVLISSSRLVCDGGGGSSTKWKTCVNIWDYIMPAATAVPTRRRSAINLTSILVL